MPKSTSQVKQSKPDKPHPDYPLFAHATRRWAKKIRGRLHYFGPWRDAEGALARYLDQKDDLQAGRPPRHRKGELTVADLANHFLAAKEKLVGSGDMAQGSFRLYYRTAGRMVAFFGRQMAVADLRPDDFARLRADLGQGRAPSTLASEMAHVRSIFRYAESDMQTGPVHFGSAWRTPSAKVRLQARYAKGSMMFEREEIHGLLAEAGRHLAAMIHLGVNCAFGPLDLATLPESSVDLATGWCTHARPKTGIFRRTPLWPETVLSLRESLAHRPQASDREPPSSFFVNQFGRTYATGGHCQIVKGRFTGLLRKLDMTRPSRGFYGLRRTFETIAGESIDRVAVDFIMGHGKGDMASVYRRRMSDERLVAVTDHVRGWLFGAKAVE